MTITVCVCGTRFVTTLSTLGSKPRTKLADECTEDGKEYFFDRNAELFASILDYYRTGELHMPTNACVHSFKNELEFWGIDGNTEISACCAERLRESDLKGDEQYFAPGRTTGGRSHVFPSPSLKERIYWIFEDPSSSMLAKVPAVAYCIAVIIVLLTVFINLTVASLQWRAHTVWTENGTRTEPIGSVASQGSSLMFLEIAHLVAVGYFVADFLIRLLCCPDPWIKFILTPFNIFDMALFPCLLVSVLDSFLSISLASYNFLEFLSAMQVLLVVRVLKYFRSTTTIKVFAMTVKSSLADLVFYMFLASFLALLFGSVALVCEHHNPFSQFHVGFYTVPNAMWWAIVTLSSVGYGDLIPTTPPGKFVASLCAWTGLCFMAMVFSVVHNNYTLYAGYARRQEKRSRTLVARGGGFSREGESVTLMTTNGLETESRS